MKRDQARGPFRFRVADDLYDLADSLSVTAARPCDFKTDKVAGPCIGCIVPSDLPFTKMFLVYGIDDASIALY